MNLENTDRHNYQEDEKAFEYYISHYFYRKTCKMSPFFPFGVVKSLSQGFTTVLQD